MASSLSTSALCSLQAAPAAIRNTCIVAHVDHGKTTLADALLASNGVISHRAAAAGLRYMDSRQDEQERGITMKSSAVSLQHLYKGTRHLINVIDSPGHVDFGGEVATASRLCDSCIVVVDLVEGVCPQTHAVLRHACKEGIRPLLVLNKLDRLMDEIKMDTKQAHKQIQLVLAHVNSIAGQAFLSAMLDLQGAEGRAGADQLQKFEDSEEQMYFAPESGNVIFASALGGWGFRPIDFAPMISEKIGLTVDDVKPALWGDFYYDAKNKVLKEGAVDKGKKPLFVQMILDSIWNIYSIVAVQRDLQKAAKIAVSLKVKLTEKDLKSKQHFSVINVGFPTIMSQWLPLARSTLDAICEALPPANDLPIERVHRLLALSPDNAESGKLLQSIAHADADGPLVVYISKMMAVEKKHLPQNKPTTRFLSRDELLKRREERKEKEMNGANLECNGDTKEIVPAGTDGAKAVTFSNTGAQLHEFDMGAPTSGDRSGIEFLAFARVFSGTFKPNQRVFVLQQGAQPVEATVGSLYLFMGRELSLLPICPAGNVLGIGGLSEAVFTSATLADNTDCLPLCPLLNVVEPIVRVFVETEHPAQMPLLVSALRLLSQSDPCVRTYVQDTGEHVLVTCGEVHLDRCVRDLRERFAIVGGGELQQEQRGGHVGDEEPFGGLVVSEPIVPFQETVVPWPKVDHVNEAIVSAAPSLSDQTVKIPIANKFCTFGLRAAPLTTSIVNVILAHDELIDLMDSALTPASRRSAEQSQRLASASSLKLRVAAFRSALLQSFVESCSDETGTAASTSAFGDTGIELIVDSIWSFGPKKARSNMLISTLPEYQVQKSCHSALLQRVRTVSTDSDSLEVDDNDTYGPITGQIMSCIKEGCKLAMAKQPQRLMVAMYECVIQATAEVLGKVYAVLSKRGGAVLSEDINEGTALFSVTSKLPVVESFGFANDIRTKTSGLASPQLVFSHWEVLQLDPFWVPTTEEEISRFGEKADTDNLARKYMNAVRRRKGLYVDEQLVDFAEKQRTLKRNK